MGALKTLKSLKNNRVGKNYIYNMIYHFLIMLVPLVTMPYLSRVLGADRIGIYSVSYSVADYFTLFIILGLKNHGNRSVASVKDDPEKLRKTFWSIYTMQFCVGIVITAIYFVYSVFGSFDKIAALVMGTYVVSAIIDINWFFFGMEQFKLTITRNIVIKIFSTASIFLFVKTAEDIYIYCLIIGLSMFFTAIVLWPYAFRTVPFYKPSFDEVKVHIKPNLVLFISVLAISIYYLMDKVMLGIMSTKAQAGYYELSEKILQIPYVAIKALGTVMLPRVTNMMAKKQNSTELLEKTLVFAMFMSCSVSFGIMGISREFVPLFFGEGYDACILLFLILQPASIFMAFSNVIKTQYLLPAKRDRIYVASAVVGAVINLCINLLLIPKYGAAGASVGTIITEAIVCIYQTAGVRDALPVGRYVKNGIPSLVAGVVMFVVLFNINLGLLSAVQMVIKIVMGVGIFFIIFLPLTKLRRKYL